LFDKGKRRGNGLRDVILYEFPLNERIRLFIRLEQLFHQLDHFMQGSTACDCRVAVAFLIELVSLASRSDLRSDAMQEIDRQTSVLNRMTRLQNGVDHQMLNQAIEALEKLNRDLFATPGKLGLSVMEDEFFKSIIQRSGMPGGAASFDLPGYHRWLSGDAETRYEKLYEWLEPFLPVRRAIDVLLNYIRTSANPLKEESVAGFFQKTLDHAMPYQLLRVAIPVSEPYYAEISGGKHRFTIRFMDRDQNQRPVQTSENVPFYLTSCLF
jgi:cell division protein ZapD